LTTTYPPPRWRKPEGHALDIPRVKFEIARRGLTHETLAKLAGVSELTISAALGGRPVRPQTLTKLAKALAEAPIIPGAELLAEPIKKAGS